MSEKMDELMKWWSIYCNAKRKILLAVFFIVLAALFTFAGLVLTVTADAGFFVCTIISLPFWVMGVAFNTSGNAERNKANIRISPFKKDADLQELIKWLKIHTEARRKMTLGIFCFVFSLFPVYVGIVFKFYLFYGFYMFLMIFISLIFLVIGIRLFSIGRQQRSIANTTIAHIRQEAKFQETSNQ